MTPRWPRAGLAAVVLAAVLVALIGAVLLGATVELDRAMVAWVVEHRAPIVDAAMRVATRTGSSAVLVPVAGVIAAWLSRRRRSWRPLGTVAVGYVGTVLSYSLLKAAVGVSRPDLGMPFPVPTSAAFPSGHAAQSMVVAVLLVGAAAPVLSRTSARVAAVAGLVFTASVGISRVYLGVHWPSDVLAGWTLGGLWAAALIATARRPADAAAAPAIDVVVVRNPRSGSAGAGRRAVAGLEALPVRILDEVVLDGDVDGGLHAAIATSPPGATVAVAGGDGTIGAAAAALAGRSQRLGILPAGTGNDIARALGIPLDPARAAGVVAGRIDRLIDLGDTTHGSFVHALTIGVVATFATSVRDVHGWRRPVAYPRQALAAWRDRQPMDVSVTVDGAALALPARVVQIAIINAPRLGGRVGFDLPDAALDDGRLYLLAVSDRGLGRWLATEVLRTVAPQLRQPTIAAKAAVVVIPGTVFEITAQTALLVCLDGEPVGHTPVTVRVAPRALRVAVPAPTTTAASDSGLRH